MRLTLHWRGRPLLALDMLAMSPPDEERGPALQATGFLQSVDRAEPMQPDTSTFGFGRRPESTR